MFLSPVMAMVSNMYSEVSSVTFLVMLWVKCRKVDQGGWGMQLCSGFKCKDILDGRLIFLIGTCPLRYVQALAQSLGHMTPRAYCRMQLLMSCKCVRSHMEHICHPSCSWCGTGQAWQWSLILQRIGVWDYWGKFTWSLRHCKLPP
jgi:hypothetical protein